MNLQEIESDPDQFAKNCELVKLKSLIEVACDLYYNSSDPEQELLSDQAYDALLYWYNKKQRNADQQLSKIGALPANKSRVELPFFMPSINKVKIGSGLEGFLLNTKDIVWSYKLDGVSAMIIYEDYEPRHCYLRGNGELGSDISFVLDQIKLPRLTDFPDMVVRGEMLVSKSFWQEKFSSRPQTNSRNYVSGLLNAGHVSPNLQHVEFLAFDVIQLGNSDVGNFTVGECPTPKQAFEILESQGFKVAKHGVLGEDGIHLCADVLNLYVAGKEEYPFLIDGVVLASNIARRIPTHLENPQNVVAFKINLVEQLRNTEVTEVQWNISRHGRLIPVIEFKPVYIEGARIHRATGVNAYNCVKKHKIAVGTKIKVTRSGGVIPKLVEVLDGGSETPCLPEIEWKWQWKGRDIVLCDPDSCPEVHLKRNIHFFIVMQIKGIREGMLRRMVTGGLDELDDILAASKEALRKVKGIGPKKSEQFYNDIRSGIAKVKLHRLMLASNCFPSGIGKTYIRQIVTEIPTLLVEEEKVLFGKLLKLSGIGKVRATNIIAGLKKFKVYVKKYPHVEENNLRFLQELQAKGYNKKVKNNAFVFTNLDDDDLEDYIYDHHGVIRKKVDRSVTAVVSGNISALTTKQRDAAKLGVKVYTLKEFKEQFDI